MILFFLYVGAEGSLGTWTYTLLTESRGVDETLAGFFAGSYWFTFTIGRIVAGMIAKRVGVNRLVLGGLVGALLGAPIFPAMISGTRMRVGDHHAANTIGMQMTATGFGTAIIPSLMGALANRISLEVIPAFLLAVYAGLFAFYILAIRPQNMQVDSHQFRPVGG